MKKKKLKQANASAPALIRFSTCHPWRQSGRNDYGEWRICERDESL